MANQDVSMLFGVEGEGSISSGSGSLIASQLQSILDNINKDPLKVKLGVDKDSFNRVDIQRALDSVSGSANLSIQISKIALSKEAVVGLQTSLNSMMGNIDLGKGISTSGIDKAAISGIAQEATKAKVGIAGVAQEATKAKASISGTGQALDGSARKAAEFQIQMKALASESSRVDRAMSDIGKSDYFDKESSDVKEITGDIREWQTEMATLKNMKQIVSSESEQAYIQEGARLRENIGLISEQQQVLERLEAARQKEIKSNAKMYSTGLNAQSAGIEKNLVESSSLPLSEAEQAKVSALRAEYERLSTTIKNFPKIDSLGRDVFMGEGFYQEISSGLKDVDNQIVGINNKVFNTMSSQAQALTTEMKAVDSAYRVMSKTSFAPSADGIADTEQIAQANALATRYQNLKTIIDNVVKSQMVLSAQDMNELVGEIRQVGDAFQSVTQDASLFKKQTQSLSTDMKAVDAAFKTMSNTSFAPSIDGTTDTEQIARASALTDRYQNLKTIIDSVTKSQTVLSTQDMNYLTEEINQVGDALQNVSRDASLFKKQTQSLSTEIKTIDSAHKAMVSATTSIGIDSSSDTDKAAEVQALINRYEGLKRIVDDVSRSQMILSTQDMDALVSEIRQVESALSNASADALAFKKQLDTLNTGRKSLDTSYTSMQNVGISGTPDEIERSEARAAGIKSEYQALNAEIDAVIRSQTVMSSEDFGQLIGRLNTLQAEMNSISMDRAFSVDKNKGLAQANSLLTSLTKNLSRWTAAQNGSTSVFYSDLQTLQQELAELIVKFNTGQISVKDFQAQLGRIKSGISAASGEIERASKNTQTFIERVGTLSAKFASWLSISQIIMLLYHSMQDMVRAVVDIDTAMTELRKVTNETEAAYDSFLDTASSRAKELGATISDTVTATADFARLGYGIQEASALADAALVYKNVGDGIEDISTASESIIATMQAFGIEAEDAMSIVDRFNETGNNFAISSAGVGEALLRSASALAAANNDLDESIALITAANTTVQDPEKVGTTMKTISMYLRAAKTEAEEAGESTEGMAASVSDLRQEILDLTGQQVDIQIDEDTFKSSYQIIKELSMVWDQLTDISQANILEMIGGKRNANVTAALIENMAIAEETLAVNANSAGSALEENAIQLESIQGKITQFQAAFQSLAQNMIGSDLVKSVVDMGTGFLNMLDSIASLVDTLGGANNALVTMASLFVVLNIQGITALFGKLGAAILTAGKSVKAFALALTGVQIAVAAVVVVISALVAAYNANKKSDAEMRQSMIETGNAAKEESKDLTELLRSYEELSVAVDNNLASKDDLIAVENELLTSLGYEGERVQELAAEYDSLSTAVAGATRARLQANIDTAVAGDTASKEDAAVEIGDDWLGDFIDSGGNRGVSITDRDVQDYLIGSGYEYNIREDSSAVSFEVALPNSQVDLTFDEAIENQEHIQSVMNAVKEQFGSDNEAYKALAVEYDRYTQSLEPVFAEISETNKMVAEDAIWAIREGMSDNPIDTTEFAAMRDNIIEEISQSDDFDPLGDMTAEQLADYAIAQDSRYDLIASSYAAEQAHIQEIAFQRNAILQTLLDPKNLEGQDSGIKDAITAQVNALSDTELDALSYAISQGATSWQDATSYIEEYNSEQAKAERYALGLQESIGALWEHENFEDTKSELAEIFKSVRGIDADNIEELAAESEELANALAMEGVDATFLAQIFEMMLEGGDGLSLITADALELNEALSQMDYQFDNVSAAKARFDAAMSAPAKDDSFRSYAEAYQVLVDEMKAGTDNSNEFWAAAEHLFGSEQLDDWGWSDGIANIEAAMKANKILFSDAESSGALLLSRLNQIAVAGQIKAPDGSVLMTLTEGGFQVDSEDIGQVADILGITEEALLATMEALSNYGDISFYNLDQVYDAIKEYDGLTLETPSITGVDTTFVNVDATRTALAQLGYSAKDIYDIIENLKTLDDVSLIDISGEADSLLSTFAELKFITQDGMTFNINYQDLIDFLVSLNYTEEDIQDVITKMSELSGVEIKWNTPSGEEGNPFSYLEGLDLTPVEVVVDSDEATTEAGTLTDALKGVFDTVTNINELALNHIAGELTTLTNLSNNVTKAVERIKTALDRVDGTKVDFTVSSGGTVSSPAVDAARDFIASNASGTDSSEGGKSLTGEEGPELVQSGSEAYFVGLDGPEIVDLNKGDRVYTAEQTEDIVSGSASMAPPEKMDSNVMGTGIDTSKYVAPSSGGNSAEEELEEKLEEMADLFDELIGDFEHRIFLLENQGADVSDIVFQYELMQKAVHEQAQKYRDMGLDENSDYIQDLQKQWWDYENTIAELWENSFTEMISALQESVDTIQDVYAVLTEAAQEFAVHGFISVDSLQSIIDLGVEYLAFLQDENGQLVINRDSIERMTAARTEQLAVESALVYIERIRLALENNNVSELNKLIDATQIATGSTWDMVYANLALLDLGEQQYQSALENVNALRALSDGVIANIGVSMDIDGDEASKELEEMLEMQQGGLSDILDYVMELVKWEAEKQVEALEEQISDYEKIVELKKESLDASKANSDYEEGLAEKLKEVAEIQERINTLSLDDSRESQSQQTALKEELEALQKEIGEYQEDQMATSQDEILDDMVTAYEEEKQKEIDIIEESVSSTEKIYRLAIDRINSDWENLYGDLLAYNYEYGSHLEKDIIAAWEAASEAVLKYGSYVSAVAGVDADLDSLQNGSSDDDEQSDVVGNTNYGNADVVESIIRRMYQNSLDFHVSDPDGQKKLSDENLELGARLIDLGIPAVRDEQSGVWYVGSVGSGDLLYENYRKYLYHSGGVAGDEPTLEQNEILATLEKGELVLDKEKENGLVRIMDFVTNISDKFSSLMSGGMNFPSIGKVADLQPAGIAPINETSNNTVTIGDVIINGGSDATVEKHREVTREFTNEILKQLNIKR